MAGPRTGLAAYLVAATVADSVLALGQTVVIDAVAPVADNLARALEWVRRAGHNETPKGTSGP